MTQKILLGLCLLVAGGALAQKAAVTDIPTEGTTTTISVTKGGTSEREFDILSGSAEINGDPAPLSRSARDSWKSACAEWKSEVKDLNKENQVLALNCGLPKCSSENSQTTCVSSGSYQLKVRIKK
jgi:hypothetical protein